MSIKSGVVTLLLATIISPLLVVFGGWILERANGVAMALLIVFAISLLTLFVRRNTDHGAASE